MKLSGRSGSRKLDVRAHCKRLELCADTTREANALAVIFYCSVTGAGLDYTKLAEAAQRLAKQAAAAKEARDE